MDTFSKLVPFVALKTASGGNMIPYFWGDFVYTFVEPLTFKLDIAAPHYALYLT